MIALPILFAAGMTLTDSTNGVLMLRIYESAQRGAVVGLLRLNVVVTGLSIVSGLAVSAVAVAALLTIFVPSSGPVIRNIADTDALLAGLVLTGAFSALVCLLAWFEKGARSL